MTIPVALQTRLDAVVQSRAFDFGIAFTALQGQAALQPGNMHNGRLFGPQARAEANAALEVLARDYLQFCQDELIDPATHIEALRASIEKYASDMRTRYASFAGASAFGPADAANIRLYDECISQFLIEANGAIGGVTTGRLHGKQVYRHEKSLLRFLRKHIVPIVIAAITAVASTLATNGIIGK